MDFYGTSEFWYTMRDILRIGGHYTAYSFQSAASKYCQTPWRILLDRFLKRLYGSSDFYRLRSVMALGENILTELRFLFTIPFTG